MPENIDPIQQPQNFAPIKKPNFWHRALFWLSGLTPKHKAVLAMILVLAVAAIAAILYFTLAAGEPSFNFQTVNRTLEVGKEAQIDVVVKPGNIAIKTLDMTIRYNPAEADVNVMTGSLNQYNDANNKVLWDLVTNDKANGVIIIEKDPAYVSTFNNEPVSRAYNFISGSEEIVISLFVTPLQVGTLNLSFSTNSGDNVVYNTLDNVSLNPILPPYLILNNISLTVAAQMNPGTIYLEPSNADGFNGGNHTLYVGDTFDVNLMLKSGEDTVAVAVDINYDNNVLSLDSVLDDGAWFTEQGVESTISEANNNGVYNLVRGYHGDLSPGNGNNSKTVKVATLKFIAIGLINNSETFTDVTLTNKQGVKDDGQGTPVNLASAAIPPLPDGRYKINEKPLFAAGVIITKGPEVHVQKDVNGIWNAEIYWETNVDANAQVIYDQQAPDGSFNLDGSASLEPAVPGAVLSKQHQITLTGLTEGATYRYQVISQDGNHNEVRDKNLALTNDSRHHQFIVKEELADLTIKNLSAKASYNSATISWNTAGGNSDGLANSQIVSCGGGAWTNDTTNYSLSHSIAVSGLNNNTQYSCTVKSTNIGKINNESAVCTTKNPCTVTFKTKLGQDFDANIVLKVMPDRICDKWLYCRSAVEVVNNKDEKESLCFDVGLCNEQNSDGECVSTTDLSALGITAAEQTFKHPVNVSQIQNLSGYSKVGLDWGNGKIITGNYNVGIMEPVGADINLVNGDFETGEPWPWKAASNAELSVIYKNESRVLKIKPQVPTGANQWLSAEVPLGFISREPGYDYAISMSIWSAGSARDVDVELKVGSAYYTVAKVTINNAPQTIVLTSNQKNSQFAYGTQSGQGALAIGDRYEPIKSGYFSDDIYLDNVSLKSVLPINSQEKISRSCRLYPSMGAIACDTVDANGKVQRGWRGFCLEQDIKYQSSDQEKKMCLNWWPVDIIPGETDVFGKDNQAGYLGRQPLYYCMEAAGNYPYVKTTRTGGRSLLYQYCDENNVAEMLIGGYIFGPIGAFIGAEIPNDKKICGWKYASGRQTMRAPDEIGLRDIDIERIVLQPLCEGGNDDEHCFSKKENSGAYLVLDRKSDWQDFLCIGSNCQGDEYYKTSANLWGSGVNMINNNNRCGNQAVDFFAVRAVFEDGEFVGLETGLCNNGIEQGFVRYKSTFYLRESCNVIAQVVTPDGENMAWASKVKRGGWLKDSSDNYLGYEYGTDYEPYGAAVVGAPASDPTEWFNPLYVMPLDDALGYEAPYQVRAGTPYGVINKLNLAKQCVNPSKAGWSCQTNSECNVMGGLSCEKKEPGSCDNDSGGQIDCYNDGDCPANVGGTVPGVCNFEYYCKGTSIRCDADPDICATISQEQGVCQTIINEKDRKIGKAQCISGEAENLGTVCSSSYNCGFSLDTGNKGLCMGVNLSEKALANIYGGYDKGKDNLKRLFAKSYRVWKWAKKTDGTLGYIEVGLAQNFGWDISVLSEYALTKPEVFNVKVKGQSSGEVNIVGPKRVKLEFNSKVNADHLPLTAFRVDWGDATPVSQVNNLKIEARNTASTPHVLFHTYECASSPCTYVPKIQVEDNWGWCNNGVAGDKCPENKNTWQGFGVSVIVK